MAGLSKKYSLPLFALLAALSFALRVYKINQSLWYDEIYMVFNFLSQPWQDVFWNFSRPNNHILYTLLAKLSANKFGLKEWSLRLPSLVLGAFIPPACYALYRKRLGDFTSFLAALFLALNFWSVWFGQDARGYSGLILFSMLSQLLFLELLQERKIHKVIFYILSCMIASYFHLYMLFIIAGHIIYSFLGFARQKYFAKTAGETTSAMSFIIPCLALALSISPYLLLLNQMNAYFGGVSHVIEGRWLDLAFLKDAVRLFSGSHILWVGGLFLVVFIPGAVRLYKADRGVFWIYVIPAALIITSTFILHIFIYARFLSFAMPFFCLGLALGIDSISEWAGARLKWLKKQYSSAALGALAAAVLLASLSRYYQLGKQDYKDAAAYAKTHYPYQAVLAFGMGCDAFQYYFEDTELAGNFAILTPEKLRGRLVVASFPGNWPDKQRKILFSSCKIEKAWLSAAGKEQDIYLFKCG